MKAKLIFDLGDIDQRIEHLRCVKSLDMALVIWEMASNAKKECYRIAEGKELNGEEVDHIDLVFQKFYEILEEHSICIDDLVI
jgi:hypothetical protein